MFDCVCFSFASRFSDKRQQYKHFYCHHPHINLYRNQSFTQFTSLKMCFVLLLMVRPPPPPAPWRPAGWGSSPPTPSSTTSSCSMCKCPRRYEGIVLPLVMFWPVCGSDCLSLSLTAAVTHSHSCFSPNPTSRPEEKSVFGAQKTMFVRPVRNAFSLISKWNQQQAENEDAAWLNCSIFKYFSPFWGDITCEHDNRGPTVNNTVRVYRLEPSTPSIHQRWPLSAPSCPHRFTERVRHPRCCLSEGPERFENQRWDRGEGAQGGRFSGEVVRVSSRNWRRHPPVTFYSLTLADYRQLMHNKYTPLRVHYHVINIPLWRDRVGWGPARAGGSCATQGPTATKPKRETWRQVPFTARTLVFVLEIGRRL